MGNDGKITVARLAKRKGTGEKITVLTAYDSPIARCIDEAGVDIVVVSDAVGTIGQGRPEAFSVTVEQLVYHCHAVKNATSRSLVAVTMPFGSYNTVADGVANATRLVKEGGAEAVHVEGGEQYAPLVSELVRCGIPVIGHVGLTKLAIAREGRPSVQGRHGEDAVRVISDAAAIAKAGAFALIVECVPDVLAKIITRGLPIPTIGVGSGPFCDGQFLVTHDMLGLYAFKPKFVKKYGEFGEMITAALSEYRREVGESRFPTSEYSYSMDERELDRLLEIMSTGTSF